MSITIPHKENALRYLKEIGAEIEPLAETIGAVNTIAIDRSDETTTLRGVNTDYAAILDSITDKLGITREALSNYRVAVIGAGKYAWPLGDVSPGDCSPTKWSLSLPFETAYE